VVPDLQTPKIWKYGRHRNLLKAGSSSWSYQHGFLKFDKKFILSCIQKKREKKTI
jgi:hypothetical protein